MTEADQIRGRLDVARSWETPAAEETPAEAARADRNYWADYEYDTEPDDPSHHYRY